MANMCLFVVIWIMAMMDINLLPRGGHKKSYQMDNEGFRACKNSIVQERNL